MRWRVVQWLFVLASVGMVPLILSGKDYQWSTIGTLISLSLGYALLAVAQGVVARVAPVIEGLGLAFGGAVYSARFARILSDVASSELPPEALADIFPWALVLYGAFFIALPGRLALASSLVVWLGLALYGFAVLPGSAVRGFEPMLDLSLSGGLMILILTLFRRLVEAGARAEARASTLSELAVRDSLTGLYNRRFLDEKLAEEFARAARYGHPLSIALCDIDAFKAINDTHSHEVGDETLRLVATLLTNNVRATDIVARYGGEEFVIVFVETSKEAAVKVAEALCHTVRAYDWSQLKPDLKVTVSIGLAQDSSLANHERLLHQADLKLYEAKREGKNQVRY